jgi:hypothetical protein
METTIYKTMETALNKMGKTFTANEFYRVCRVLNIPEHYLKNGHAQKFLFQNCELVSRKVYRKKVVVRPRPDFHEQVVTTTETSDVQKMINHLTQLGYRVMMPKTEWVDVN